MSGSIRIVTSALLTILWLLSVGSIAKAEDSGSPDQGRRLVVVEGADYFGLDYETLRDLDLAACQAACLVDQRCRAFTYNAKARWCFLKSDYGDLRGFAGAVSGYIQEGAAGKPELESKRISELRFLPKLYLEEARRLADRVAQLPLARDRTFDQLVANAQSGLLSGQPRLAARLFESGLRQVPDSPSLWLGLADADQAIRPPGWRERQRLREDATAAAVNGYLRSETETDRARALSSLGGALVERSAWRPAIRAYRASLSLVGEPNLRARYEKLLSEHGFRITGHRVDSEALNPRLCVELSDPLPRERSGLSDFVQLEGDRGLAVELEQQQICIDGVVHGERYRVRIRAGLPAADGETLAKTADLDVYVRDRSPSVRFLGRAYLLPRGGQAAIPLVSVNSGRIDVELYRVGDRSMAGLVGDGTFLKQLSGYDTKRIGERRGEVLWTGSVEVEFRLNREVTTAVPIADLIGDLEPGAYVMTAKPRERTAGESETLATQWFVVSDFGLAAFSGNDGLHAIVRSLSSAGPVAGVGLRLVARNDEVLGRAVTDAAGYARFEPGLLRGGGGNSPALLVAEGEDGDYAFLDLAKPAFDLSDRGVEGRPAPKPVDVFMVAERGVYRPGETVQLTALVRDDQANAVPDLPLTLVVRRPDGVEHTRVLTSDQGLGGRHMALRLLPNAMRGTWRASLYADQSGPALAERAFLVDDFEPERLAFDLAASAQIIDPADPPTVRVDARFLYGAPAAGLAIEGEVLLEPAQGLAAHPGFRFGLAREEVVPVSRSLSSAATDGAGNATLALALPDVPPVSRPLEAEVSVRVLDGGGRPVERSLRLPVASGQTRIGIRPLFVDSVDDGGVASFEVITVGPDGGRQAHAGLRWTLSKVHTSFQWYQLDGTWDYEPVVTRRRVASGNLDLGPQGSGHIESPVEWGGYELEVGAPQTGIIPASLTFEAGWYQAPGTVDTPDLLKVSLDKPRYRIGDTALVRVEPRFPGLALVMVIDDGLVSMTPVQVPDGGATLELPVTVDWGPGAYVTAVLYRPMDLAARRMPARALGLTWAGVDPGSRRLDLELGVSEKVEPRAPLDIDLTLSNLSPGEEAYVTLAVVDVGILNLTRYAAPAPEDWYFGQRRLGMEIRDLYGQLIDRMQGVPGVIRSGGDGAGMRLEGPPPTEELVAFHSGILRVDESGRARVSFDIPDFNGRVRVMAMAWSASGVGHAARDLVVRDPIVVTTSLPRFLAPGDKSRVLVDLAHVEGPAGEVTLAVESGSSGILVDGDAAAQSLMLDAGARARVLVPLEAVEIGDHPLRIRVTTPDGQALEKSLTIPVRSNDPSIARGSVVALEPGGAGLSLAGDMLEDLVPGTGSVLVSVTGAGRLDVPGLLRALDLYPYGCAEQLTSRALPLLYLDQVALSAGLSGEAEAAPRVREAIADLLGKQAASGSFGLWGPGGSDLWLDSYVTDFLTRAREQGYDVSDRAFTTAVDNLRNRLAYASDFQSGGEDIAYALYVLARNARAVIGDLRYFAESKLDGFATPLAKAQLGAALALYGDRPRADAAFRAALEHQGDGEGADGWRRDYGSALRDAAGVLTLAAESGSQAVDIRALATGIEAQRGRVDYTSTQENAWLLLAAHALMEGAARPELAVDGGVLDGPFYRSFGESELASGPVTLANLGAQPVDALVTVTGVPLLPPPAGGSGYRIERAYYDLEGRRVQPDGVTQGERLLVVISVHADAGRAARLIVNDPLPAGFEIDNPNLIRAGDVTGIPWLGLVEVAAHKELRADRFVAALDRGPKDRRDFQLAYRVRAVSPGSFKHPAATVEDMYRPHLRGWTGQGLVEVRGDLR